jgi:hypothetical protein
MTETPIVDASLDNSVVIYNGTAAAMEILSHRCQASKVSTAVGMLYALRAMLLQVDDKATRELFHAMASGQTGNEADELKAQRICDRIYRAADALAERDGAVMQ